MPAPGPSRALSLPAVALLLASAIALPPAEAAARKRHHRPAAAASASAESPTSYRHRPEVAAFAAEVAERRGLDAAWVQARLAQAVRLPEVARLIMPPPAGTAKNWAAYRDRFVEPARVAAGMAFWVQHADALQRAEQEYGVPAAIVAGIIGVETYYGRFTGRFRVLDALATLAFDFPPGRKDRSAFFRSELEELLVLCRREGIEPATLRGSYAGAIGLPQFMPGSINRHATDFDGDGHVDLRGSAADAIGSVARYLAAHGWQRGLPTHHAVKVPVDAAERALLLGPDILPSFSAAQFADHGAELDEAGRAHEGLLALVELQNGEAAPSYVAGTQNFYAITRYNWSSYYAMAVIVLGEAVQAAVSARRAGAQSPAIPRSMPQEPTR